MVAYYNEHDPFAAEWLRQLIAKGAIAPGFVDERSILDVKPEEIQRYTQCHFFAGIGVWSYALRQAGWPDDIPVWTGSCPCQPFSAAGKGKGFADKRHLWPVWFWLIEQCQPDVIFGEQVAGKAGSAWFDLVSTDLEARDYSCGAAVTAACGFGAPHMRKRLYWVANHPERRRQSWPRPRHTQPTGQRRDFSPDSGESGGLADNDSPGPPARKCQELPGEIRHDKRGAAQQCCCPSSRMDDSTSREGFRRNLARHHSEGQQILQSEDRKDASKRTSNRREIADSRVGNADGGDTKARRHQCLGEQRLLEGSGSCCCREGGTVGGTEVQPSDESPAGPTNGFWRTADWLFCRDGKWRPVESGHVEMVDGTTSRLGQVCLDDPTQKRFLQRMQILRENFSEEEIQRQSGIEWSFSEESILQSFLHGELDGRSNKSTQHPKSSETIQESQEDPLCRMSSDRRTTVCSSHRQEPDEQHPSQLNDVVRFLPQSLSLAKLYRRREDFIALSLLYKAICKEASVQHSPHTAKKVWPSLSKEAKSRIRMDFDASRWRVVAPFPLSGAKETINRVGRLRGYGNALCAPQAQGFIEAYLEL